MNRLRGRGFLIPALLLLFGAFSVFALWLIGFRLSAAYPGGFYGFQTEAFASHQLYLKIAPHPELAKLANPYDGSQNAPFRILDLSYYRGRYYSYFGIGPILLLTLPWRLATHTYLTEAGATVIFTIATYALSLELLLRLRRFYFPGLSPLAIAAAYSLVTVGNCATIHLTESSPGTVAQAGAYFCFDAGLLCLLGALTGGSPVGGIAFASLFCGLSVACRPSFAPIVAMILPVAYVASNGVRRSRLALKVGLAALLPCAAIAAGLMYYNYVRFDSVWEFGNRFQLTGADYRKIGLFAPAGLLRRLPEFIAAPLELSHYFPFFVNHHDVVPVGLLWLCPASVLSIGLASYLRSSGVAFQRGAAAVALGVSLAFAGILGFLAAYVLFLFHYEVDFMVIWVWVVTLGWFGAMSDARIKEASRRAIRVVGIGLCGITVLIAAFFTLSVADLSPRLRSTAAVFDRAVYKIDQLRGVSYGGVRLKVRFRSAPAGASLPMLVTGYDQGDMVYARVAPGSSIQIGFFHAGIGGPLGEPMAVDLSRSHDVEIFMGSLLPPTQHPFFRGWNQDSVLRAKRTLEVKIDGRLALSGFADFYDSSPANILIGSNPRLGDVAGGRFSGDISLAEVLPFSRHRPVDDRVAGTGAVAIRFRLPPGRPFGTEPLLSTGKGDRGDLVYISYLPNSMARFGLEHWGAAAFVSEPMNLDPAIPHTIVVISNSLAKAGSVLDRFEVICDSRSVLAVPLRTYACAPEQIYFGINSTESSRAVPMFSGTVLDVVPVEVGRSASPNLSESLLNTGTVALEVLFNEPVSGSGQPLLVVGRTGRADMFYVNRIDFDHLRFGFDHWGVGGTSSQPLKFDPNRRHQVEIYLGSLRSMDGQKDSTGRNHYRIAVDGQAVLEGKADLYPFGKDQIYIGMNPLGGSTSDSKFQGEIRIRALAR